MGDDPQTHGGQADAFSDGPSEHSVPADLGARPSLLERVADDAAEGIVVTGPELAPPGPRILWVNRAFTRITGYEADEIRGETPRILQGPRTQAAVLQRLREALAREERFEGEAINYRKDGTPFVNHWSIAPLYADDGTLQYWVSVQRDVTEHRRLQRGIVRVLDDERRRVGRALHDSVGSELVAASMRLDHLARSDDLPGDLADRLRDIRSSVVDGYSRLQRLSKGLSPVDLAEGALDQALQRLAVQTPSCRFILDEDVSALVEARDADARADLYWIAHEAVTNAHEHADPGTIRLWMGRGPDGLRLRVEDDGAGFDPSTPSDGWGLRMMQYRADLLGARLSIESTPREGTRVTCDVPR
jgi:PAS domain S-box-containing protein